MERQAYARNHFDCRLDFDAGGCSTEMAPQPGLGLFSERRSGVCLIDPDHLATFRSNIDWQRRKYPCHLDFMSLAF